MKKYIYFTLLLGMLTTTSALAETCANGAGTVITSNMGQKYCFGTSVTMNWWSAFSWCESAGYTLADMTQDCNCTASDCPQSDAGSSSCTNFIDVALPSSITSNYFWTRSVDSSNPNNAYSVYKFNSISSISRSTKSNSNSPLCRM